MKHNKVKYPDWPETKQLAIDEHIKGRVEPRTSKNKFS